METQLELEYWSDGRMEKWNDGRKLAPNNGN